MQQLFNKWIEVQFTYQFVECFYTVFKLAFKERLCTKKYIFFDIAETVVNFNQHLKRILRMPGGADKNLLWKKL